MLKKDDKIFLNLSSYNQVMHQVINILHHLPDNDPNDILNNLLIILIRLKPPIESIQKIDVFTVITTIRIIVLQT